MGCLLVPLELMQLRGIQGFGVTSLHLAVHPHCWSLWDLSEGSCAELLVQQDAPGAAPHPMAVLEKHPLTPPWSSNPLTWSHSLSAAHHTTDFSEPKTPTAVTDNDNTKPRFVTRPFAGHAMVNC